MQAGRLDMGTSTVMGRGKNFFLGVGQDLCGVCGGTALAGLGVLRAKLNRLVHCHPASSQGCQAHGKDMKWKARRRNQNPGVCNQ